MIFCGMSFMDAPRYSYPPGLFAALARDILFLRRRDFHQDAQACVARLSPPLKLFCPENIPHGGPCVVTVNHYHRRGFKTQWLALAVGALIPVKMHWIMTGEFRFPGGWSTRPVSWGSQILLQRIAHIYGFTTMPPMPPREKDVQRRAASIRAVLEYVMCAREPEPVLGLAPEGYDATDTGVLARPFRGVGRFALLLSKAGLKFSPVGAYEEDGEFHLHFGEAYELQVRRGLSTEEKDRQASQMIMERIAVLLPAQLRGEFG